MDDLLDVLSSGSRPASSMPLDTAQEKMELAVSLQNPSDDEADDADGLEESDGFDLDLRPPPPSRGNLSPSPKGGVAPSSSSSPSSRPSSVTASSLVAAAGGRRRQSSRLASSQVVAHDDSAEPLHNALLTPRVAATQYDPPGYVPALDMDGLLAAYRRIREALLLERASHKTTKEEILVMNRKITVCKNLGESRMKKISTVRDKQDGFMASWKELEIRHKKQKAVWDKDITELVQELRPLKKALEYELSQVKSEEKKMDYYDDLIVKKDDELRRVVGEVGQKSKENDLVHKAKKSLTDAFDSVKVVADESELLVEEVHQKLADAELDTIMLQRQVKAAEDDARAWKSRYALVERDVQRAEKLLSDFAESKGVDAQTLLSQEVSKTNIGDKGVLPGRGVRQSEKAAATNRSTVVVAPPFKASPAAQLDHQHHKSLSSIARSFNGIDDLVGRSQPSFSQAPPTALMAAVLPSRAAAERTLGAFDYFGADEQLTESPDDFAHASHFGGKVTSSSTLPRINKDYGGAGANHAKGTARTTKTLAQEKKRTGEVVEGMSIDFHDSYSAIVANNNRRGTAKDRSVSQNAELWPMNPSQWPD